MSTDPVFERLQGLLQHHEGICIGECHDDVEAPCFLAKHMKDFAAAGVTALFVECIEHIDQDMLDHFQETGETEKEFPPQRYHFGRALDWELNRWAKGGNREDLKTAYLAMMNAARECNIKIYGMDDYGMQGDHRLELSNPVWAQVIRDKKPEDGKFLAHGGFYHFSRLDEKEQHVEPVSESLGVPSVHFSVQPGPEVTIKGNADNPLAASLTVSLPAGKYSASFIAPKPSHSGADHAAGLPVPVLG